MAELAGTLNENYVQRGVEKNTHWKNKNKICSEIKGTMKKKPNQIIAYN